MILLFGEFIITKESSYVDKCQLSGSGIGFDSKESFSHPSERFGQNLIIFGVDIAFSLLANNRTKNVLILREGITQIVDTTLTAEKMYSINVTKAEMKVCIIMEMIPICLSMAKKSLNLKQKILKLYQINYA